MTSSFSDVITNGKLTNFLDGAEKIVFLSHGFLAGDKTGCSAEWEDEMAENIQKVEGQKVVTVALCWNSATFSSLQSLFGGRRRSGLNPPSEQPSSGLKPRLDIFSSVSGTCQADYTMGGKYYYCASSTAKLGEMLGGMMRIIKEETSISYFHGIGHSLGAHIMGNVWNFGEFKMDRISGLDPAGPCFDGNTGEIEIEEGTGSVENLWGLHKNAASFVDIYHTDGDYFGTTVSKGHLDLFAGKYLLSLTYIVKYV